MSPRTFVVTSIALAMFGAALVPSAHAQARPVAPGAAQGGVLTPETAPIKRLMEEKFPGANIGPITKTPLPGIFEVLLEDQLVYTDAKVTYLMVGSMYESTTKRNLTEERKRKLTRIAWDSLPLDLAMKKVKGNGQRKLAVFADADCPFCARFENDLKSVDNVTIYTFMYPLDQLHPDAARKTRQIWCASDRQAAWDTWFEQKKLPDNKGECDTPIEKTAELGMKLKVNATPTVVFADGTMIPGAVPAARIEQEFKTIDTEAASVAAAPQAAAPAPAPNAAAKAKK